MDSAIAIVAYGQRGHHLVGRAGLDELAVKGSSREETPKSQFPRCLLEPKSRFLDLELREVDTCSVVIGNGQEKDCTLSEGSGG